MDIKIIENNKGKILNSLDDAIERALLSVGMVAEGHAKAYETAVDTGRLRNSITHEMESEDTVAIGTNVEYAPYIEFGHRTPSGGHTAGIHYLERAIMNHMGQYKSIIEKELSK